MYGLVLQEFEKNDYVWPCPSGSKKNYHGANLATIALALARSSIDG